VLLPLDDARVVAALRELLVDSPVGDVLSAVLGSDARLRELSTLVADPGAPRQVAHPDTPWHAAPALLTCFVALQPVEPAMGPTLFYPRTHDEKSHGHFFSSDETEKDHFLASSATTLSTLGLGDVSIFDSRTVHCGTANLSEKSRYLFYVSFLDPRVPDPGNPGSIRPAYDHRLSLADLTADLTPRRSGEVPARFRALSRADHRDSSARLGGVDATPKKKKAPTKKKKKAASSGRGFGSAR